MTMKSSINFKKAFLVALPPLVIAASFWLPGFRTSGQTENKSIGRFSQTENEPIKITKLNTEGKEATLDKAFSGSDDWLKSLSIEVENVSGQPLVYIDLELLFPDTLATGNIMGYSVEFGQNSRARVPRGEPIRFMPKAAKTLSLSEKHYENLRQFLEKRQPLSTINKVLIWIRTIYFEDGRIWHVGSFVRPDPSNPKRLVPIEDKPNIR
jgi:hypothetical protein